MRRLPLTAPDSLAQRLARTLTFWIGGVWLLCVLGVVWYIDREINYNFDSELSEVSHRMFDIAIEQYDGRPALNAGDPPAVAGPPIFSEDSVIYQLVDSGTRVLLRTPDAHPSIFDIPLAPGFYNSNGWRIYTVRHPQRDIYLQVADPLDERSDAVNRTLVGLIIPLVAVLPLLTWLLQRIARRELLPLQALADEIGRRSGEDLRPIELPGRPSDELRSVADDVNRLLERLSQALNVERALAANAAHELRTPLATARLRLQTALDHELTRRDVEAALDALRTLSHRAEKLLQLSRAESGASLARTPVDLVKLAGAVAEEFWQDTRVSGRLDLCLPDEALSPALGDVDALAIALRNLIENALRYSGNGRVTLEVAAPCTLIVRDFGPGVPPQLLDTLRQRHVRQTDNRAGYGLGLSIVTTIAHQHHAALELISPPAGAATGFEARLVLPSA